MAEATTDNGVPAVVAALCETALLALVDDVARAMGSAAFLQEDPASYRAGVRDVTAALLGRLAETRTDAILTEGHAEARAA